MRMYVKKKIWFELAPLQKQSIVELVVLPTLNVRLQIHLTQRVQK